MSEFSEAMAGATTVGQSIFGDTCYIAGYAPPITCIVWQLGGSTSVVNGRPGRVSSAEGVITMTVVEWALASGRKGIQLTLLGKTYRVVNDPDIGFTSDIVELQLGPLN
jgi:hypothetical protein